MRGPSDPVKFHDPAQPLGAMAQQPWAYDFFHALRWIEARHPDERLGTARKPVDEPVRLGQAPELSFAPSALHAVVPAGPGGRPASRCASPASSVPTARCRCS